MTRPREDIGEVKDEGEGVVDNLLVDDTAEGDGEGEGVGGSRPKTVVGAREKGDVYC